MAYGFIGGSVFIRGGGGKPTQNIASLAKKQCFGSIFIESGSSHKSESGSKLFLNTYLKFFLNYFIIIRFSHQKKSIER